MIEILMVDDDEGDILLVKEALNDCHLKHNLHTAHDGIEATMFLNREQQFKDAPRPDLILLDLNMPRMNGHETLSWLKDNEAFRAIPVIILTTSNAQKDIIESYNNLANCFVTKPSELGQFDEVIKAIERFWIATVTLPPQAASDDIQQCE